MSGYSGKPLAAKLGIKAGFRVAVLDAPPHYAELVAPLPESVTLTATLDSQRYDCIHLFVTHYAELEAHLSELKTTIVPNGMIWISWPKRAAKLPTDVSEDRIRDLALAIGLVDVKVCAVDATWSGLKLVIPVAARPGTKAH